MKKIWGYVLGASAFLFAGMSAGLLLARKTAGDQYKAYISKIKNRGTDTDQEVVFRPVLGATDGLSTKSNKDIRLEKKAAKIARRNDKKKKRAIERLNTNVN